MIGYLYIEFSTKYMPNLTYSKSAHHEYLFQKRHKKLSDTPNVYISSLKVCTTRMARRIRYISKKRSNDARFLFLDR
ncbi:hypothetical protein TRFO_27447 [Tritrichomonas foetus]|uniref:Uncharacterized protein n=1 Tax=Tritrichomonas foetus TaxID=1144522 RepID=A0A1J4K2C7_9EUKA|nr:hypothetical protein TRFO_27447 [Tritrichomonas foetus]|eukprot:OHT04944.1 hypothetical protein TRFO_27447 [Tritrichomonas foetus]